MIIVISFYIIVIIDYRENMFAIITITYLTDNITFLCSEIFEGLA